MSSFASSKIIVNVPDFLPVLNDCFASAVYPIVNCAALSMATAANKKRSPSVVHLAWVKYKQQLIKKPLQTKV